MPRKKEPLAVLEARGRVHTAKAELEERRSAEVTLAAPTEGEGSKIRAPEWLPKYLRAEFNELRTQLVEARIFGKLDRDVLGYYLMARRQYTAAAQKVQDFLDAEDSESAQEWANLQDKFFKQARACANDMGLNISSRCRLVVPKKEQEDGEDAFLALLNRRRA